MKRKSKGSLQSTRTKTCFLQASRI